MNICSAKIFNELNCLCILGMEGQKVLSKAAFGPGGRRGPSICVLGCALNFESMAASHSARISG